MNTFLEDTLMLIPKRCIGPFRLGMKVDEALKYLENVKENNIDWDDLLGSSDHGLRSYTHDWDGYLPGGRGHYVQLEFSKETGELVFAGFGKGCEVVFYGVKVMQIPQSEAIKLFIKHGGEPLEVDPGTFDWVSLGVGTYNAENPESEPFRQICIIDHAFRAQNRD